MARFPWIKSVTRLLVAAQVAVAFWLITPCRLLAGSGPAIDTQPQSQGVLIGSNAVFNVVASGQAPLSYQWSFNTINLTNNAHVGGATTATLVVSNIATSDTGNYQVAVSNIHGSVTSSNAALTVLVPAAITSPPANQSVILSNSAAFTVSVKGTPPLSYQWYFNGAPLTDGPGVTGSTSTILNLSNIQTNEAGSYQFIVTNNYGSDTSAVVSLTVLVPAQITAQPANVAATLGGTAVFSVSATGTRSLAYQWRENGTNLSDGGQISGSMTSTLTISNIQMGNVGSYQLLLTNAYGTATSAAASLLVIPAVAWGDESYDISNVPVTLTNALTIAMGDDFGLALKSDGTLAGWGLGSIANPPAGLSNIVAIAAGGDFGLAVGTNGLVTGWGLNNGGQLNIPSNLSNVVAVSTLWSDSIVLKRDGTVATWGLNAFGQNSIPSALTNTVAVAAGVEHDLALKADGTVVGWGDNTYGEISIPASATNVVAIAAGDNFNLALRSDGTVIGWGQNNQGAIVPPGLSNVIAITAGGQQYGMALKSDGTIVGWGNDSVGQIDIPAVLSNVVGISENYYQSAAVVQNPTAPAAPAIWWQQSSRTLPAGQSAVFVPQVTGSLPMTFQWFFNGAPIAGQSNSWLALPSIQPAQAGDYQFVASNNYGAVTSQVATLTESPAFTIPPVSQQIVLGSNVTFSATAAGSPALNFQWYFNGVPLTDGAGVTGSATASLSLSNIQTNQGGTYQLTVTNNYGSASAAATLTVLIPASIGMQPTNRTVLTGSNVSFAITAAGTGTLNYNWYLNGNVLMNGGRFSGATNATLTISNSQTTDSGAYQVIVTNNYGSATSLVAALTVIAPAQIIGQPASQSALLGTNVSFTAMAIGSSLSYQWYFNGMPLSDGGRISGSTTLTLNIANVQNSDAGGYFVAVSNLLSSATSITASLTPQIVLSPSVRYVMLGNTNPLSPYLDWSTAATNIQDAIDAAVPGDSVIVSNGVYNFGGRFVYGTNAPNRVVIGKSVTAQSMNGPAMTTIVGFNTSVGAYFPGRCAYLANGAFLSGFTLTKGGAGNIQTDDLVHERSGGGVWCEGPGAVISNCVFFANSSQNGYGGGAFGGTLINCLVVTNMAFGGGGAASNTLLNCVLQKNSASGPPGGATGLGGGTFGSTLSNCVLIANSALVGGGALNGVLFNCVVTNNTGSSGGGVASNLLYNCILENNVARANGGGAYSSTLYNCTVVSNTAAQGASAMWGGSATNCILYYNGAGVNLQDTKGIAYCCANPLVGGSGNFTNAPLFVNLAGYDFHLQSNSPCINSGNNTPVTVSADFDGNPRIAGGTVDMGAYEYQTPSSVISYAFLQQYGLPTDGSADFANLDGTGFNIYQDWVAGLNPTNSASVLQANLANLPEGVFVLWPSVSARTYFVQRSTNLVTQAFTTIQSNIPGHAGTSSYQDTSATNGGPYFYRVGVQR